MSTVDAPPKRTPAKREARQLAKHLRGERPDYAYLKEVFAATTRPCGKNAEAATSC